VRNTIGATLAAALILAATPCHAQKVFQVAALIAEDQFTAAYEGFRSKMSELGYVAGKNIRYELYNAKGDMVALESLAQKIVQQKPDLIVTSSTTASVPMAKLTAGTNLPVVFLTSGNPLKMVKSYSSSGNNLTGVSTSVMELTEKRLELFRQIAPRVKRLIFITDSKSPNYQEYVAATQEAAQRLGFALSEIEIKAANGDEVKKQLGRLTRKSGEGVFIPPDTALVSAAEFIAGEAIKEKLPAVGSNVQTVRRGLLAVYSADYYALGQQGAKLADKILHGARPEDLPIELPNKLELIVNLKTARAIGLKIPKEILLRADELIE
jgi:putative ABC transport system substrate-binding protein